MSLETALIIFLEKKSDEVFPFPALRGSRGGRCYKKDLVGEMKPEAPAGDPEFQCRASVHGAEVGKTLSRLMHAAKSDEKGLLMRDADQRKTYAFLGTQRKGLKEERENYGGRNLQ